MADIRFAGLIILLACLSACTVPEPQSTLAELSGTVTHIRDGDTIEVGGLSVRLRGLNCPERGTASGTAAIRRMNELAAGRRIVCKLNGETNRDRVIGWCSVSRRDLGETMIREGHCGRCARFDPERRYEAAQAAAGPYTGSVPRYCLARG